MYPPKFYAARELFEYKSHLSFPHTPCLSSHTAAKCQMVKIEIFFYIILSRPSRFFPFALKIFIFKLSALDY